MVSVPWNYICLLPLEGKGQNRTDVVRDIRYAIRVVLVTRHQLTWFARARALAKGAELSSAAG